MLLTRLWMGAILVGLGVLILVEGSWLAPWYPFLFVAGGLACLLATTELLSLLDPACRPDRGLCLAGVGAVVVANWSLPLSDGAVPDPWHIIGAVCIAVLLAAFLLEIARFRGPGRITERIALTVLVLAYLGALPSFLFQLRYVPGATEHGLPRSTMAIALTVFVPKVGDIGAYFTGKFLTGRILGRHAMTPLLSPKKTWQGFCGGMVAAIVAALAMNRLAPVLPGGTWGAMAFGLTVGIAGVLGDLAESLIKRDCHTKDASRTIPGFGGVLDVIDSLLFAAPVAYLWLK